MTDVGDTTQTVHYTYDAENQLLSRTVQRDGTTDTRYFVHDDGQVVLQFDSDAGGPVGLSHRYLWGAQVDQLLADEQVDATTSEGDVYWPLTDHLGSVRDLVESTPNGTMIEKHRFYDSFGNLLSERNRGDFDGDGDYDEVDINALIGLIVAKEFGDHEDLNQDGIVNHADLDILILQIIETFYGDGNLDGVVDIPDVNIWNAYRFTDEQGWEHGDYNGDGVIDVSDFNVWMTNAFSISTGLNLTVTDHLFGYTGRMFDEATGLQNNLHRWYDAGVGRWLSQDPIGFAAGDANLYRYVGNGVTNWTDSDGLQQQRPGNGKETWEQKLDDHVKARHHFGQILQELNIRPLILPGGSNRCHRWTEAARDRIVSMGEEYYRNDEYEIKYIEWQFPPKGGWVEHGGLVVEFADGDRAFLDDGTLGGLDHISYEEDVPKTWNESNIQPLKDAKGNPGYVDWDSLKALPRALWDLATH